MASRANKSAKHFVTQRPRAFGLAENRIRFGVEHETERAAGVKERPALNTRFGVVHTHRPRRVPTAVWLGMSVEARTQWLTEARKSLRYDAWPPMVPLPTKRWATTSALKPPDGFVLEPERLPETLEFKTKAPVDSLNQLFQTANTAKARFDPDGRTQYTTGFKNSPSHAKELTTYVAQAAEYVTLRMIAGSPKGVETWNFGMYPKGLLEAIEGEFKKASPQFENYFKSSSFAVRSGKKYGEGTVVFELRAITNNVQEARHVVTNNVRFLQDPRNTAVAFGRLAKPYRMADVEHVERLSWDSVHRLPKSVQKLFADLVGDFHPMLREEGRADDWRLRWSIPMVKWEERPSVPAEVRQRIKEARRTFVARLREVARWPPDLEATAPEVSYGRSYAKHLGAIYEAGHQFAKTTQVHQYL